MQFLPWLFTNLGIFSQCKFIIQNKRMKMAESKIEHWKSNIEQLDASNSKEDIAIKYQFLCPTEKKVCSDLANFKEVVRKLSFCKSYHSSIVYWGYQGNFKPAYFFFEETILRAQKHVTPRSFAHVKNCCLCCLVLASFCFVSWFLLGSCFCEHEIFSSKKIKNLKK